MVRRATFRRHTESKGRSAMKATKVTIHTLRQMKERGEKIAMLTVYDATFARLLDEAGTDVLLVAAGIPVMGHIGLTPQSYHQLGGFKVQGRDAGGRERLLSDARTLEEAGAYALVLEAIPMDIAREITETLSIPTIGIGAGVHC